MLSQSLTALAVLGGVVSAIPTKAGLAETGILFGRQENADSTCSVFGIDFQGGGSYFINTDSTANFTLVSQFEGCNNDNASIILVNDQTSDEYLCSSVPTVPDDVSQLSSCPILKSQMMSGTWSIQTLGNNGNGNPFAYQRDFNLTCGLQQTATATTIVPYTLTEQSTSTVESTSIITSTSSVANSQTVTSDTTGVTTYTPSAVVISQTDLRTRTFYSWTKTASLRTVYATFTPACTIPPRPAGADRPIQHAPTAMPLPAGLTQQQKRADFQALQQELETQRLAEVLAERQDQRLRKRAPDAATVTSTTTVPNNSTVTSSLSPTTITDTMVVTSTAYTTLPVATVYNTLVSTITAPTPTSTDDRVVYTRTYIAKTMSLVWTYTTTTTPSTSATACRRAGGYFG